ncbi:cellulose binding domain-containing protein [Microtetraspora malaysiensis]|uniref:cellulose binding domain-containing protein n=1 Tax=Microtetraspora malaysiensis TaxID=161358 RepID=UPI003D94CE7B
MTNFNVSQLTSWGQRLFNGANGIGETAKEATVYSGVTPSPSPSASPSSSPSPSPSASPSPSPSPSASPTGGGRACSASYTVVGQWQGGFQGEVTVAAGGAPIGGWTVKWTYADGQTVTQSWNATITSSGSSVTAKNVSYNGDLGAGASTTFGFLGSRNGPDGANGTPSLSCTAA